MLRDENNFNLNIDLVEIKNLLGKDRYQHTKLVLQAAVKLAENNKVDLKKVKTAALLHDIAKNKEKEELLELVKNSKWKLDQLELTIFPILHAPAGAIIAEKKFAIEDKEILEAVRFHSLGHPQMGKVAEIIYAADFISADRQFPAIDKIRKEIEKDFESGLYLIATTMIKYQLEQNNFVHPYSNDFRNKLLKRSD